ncbi:hypothetical protein [Halorubrum tebenquichense]|uniref:Uncharacterized protein n=1 Tax=Halorubrum tebenquichense DSM 14210 TaxID=1227485 RepID=M0DW04_9EURY|nr:hypothetical protein [Halorubrum tebenquichense]ELZ38892.1 hypothetical protein C472_05748 [Halorubrum tebenquichense DSM 14210]
MFAATEFLASLGLGSQLVMGASFAIAALYIYRAVGIARVVAGIGGLIASHALVILVVAAVAISLGWVAPNAGTALEHARIVWEFATGRGLSLARGLLEYVSVLA